MRRTESGEADRIVTLFTMEYGKIRAVAKGVRKPKSKLAGLVEMFTHCSLQISRGKGLDIISQGESVHTFLPLKTDLKRSSCAFYAVELVNRFTAEHQENARLFELLQTKLLELCESASTDILLRHFEVTLLHLVGYQPNLYRCVACNSLLQPRTNAFSPSGGGILCPPCAGTEQVARPISVNAIKVLRLLQSGDHALAYRLNIENKLGTELEQVLRSYIEYLLERRVQSAAWLDRVKHDDAAASN